MSNKGLRANWMGPIVSDRPSDKLGLTMAQEAKLAGIFGINGKAQDGTVTEKFILFYDSTDAITLTDFAEAPIGAIIIADKITKPTIFIHKAQSTNPVVGDWYKIEGTQCT